MTQHPASRNAYPSDLTDEQWRLMKPLLPLEHQNGRPRLTNLREVISAINYRDQTGCPWRMLPHDFPPWGTVYSYYRRWNRDGTLLDLRKILSPRTALSRNAPLRSAPETAKQSA